MDPNEINTRAHALDARLSASYPQYIREKQTLQKLIASVEQLEWMAREFRSKLDSLISMERPDNEAAAQMLEAKIEQTEARLSYIEEQIDEASCAVEQQKSILASLSSQMAELAGDYTVLGGNCSGQVKTLSETEAKLSKLISGSSYTSGLNTALKTTRERKQYYESCSAVCRSRAEYIYSLIDTYEPLNPRKKLVLK